MDKLRVRVYNVRFGDAILVSVPDRSPAGETTIRHILIDVGNSSSGAGGNPECFARVVENILSELQGKGLDLYIMTHEHMDHVKGLLYVDNHVYQGALKNKLAVSHAWLTASSNPGYYDSHPKAREKAMARLEMYDTLASYLAADETSPSPSMQTLLGINDPRATSAYVDYLRSLAAPDCVHYIYRGIDLEGTHDFQEACFEIWAPEEDTFEYYGRFQPLALKPLGDTAEAETSKTRIPDPTPPSGVDGGAFFDLVNSRKRGVSDNLLEIDKAENNTSIVFCLQWRGWTLLFPGDAELRSWKIMAREKVLKPVDFLKVGHHGSQNATPELELFDMVLPTERSQTRQAVVSTYNFDHYSGVPDPATLDAIACRCEKLWNTMNLEDGDYYDIEFEG